MTQDAQARDDLLQGLALINKGLCALVQADVAPTLIEVKREAIYFHLTKPSKTFAIARRVEAGNGWIIDIASQGPVGVQLILSQEEST